MTTSSADVPEASSEQPYSALREALEEEIRVKGIKPRSVEDMVCDVWESDEELDEFLADLAASRHRTCQ